MLRPFACAALLLVTGCAGGKMTLRSKPANPAPPTASLEVQGAAGPLPSGPLRLAVGGESRQVELRGDDSLVLTGTAKDSRGIKDITLQGNAVVTCSDPATGATFTRSTGFLRRHVPGTILRGSAPSERDSRFVLRVGDIARLCPGEHLESAVGQARLQASNSHGDAAATPQLGFRIAVGEAAAKAIPMPGTKSGRSAIATGFNPEAGLGGSGSPARSASEVSGSAASAPAVSAPAASAPTPAAPMAPRMCPRSAAPGHAAERRATSETPGGECLDTPVPSLSPPGVTPPGVSPPTSRVASPRRGSPRHASSRNASSRSASLAAAPPGAASSGSQRTQTHRL